MNVALVREKSLIRSLRVREGTDKSFQEISSSKNISYNALVSQIFTKYVEWDHRTEKYGYVHVSKAFFKGFVDVLDAGVLAELGTRLGTNLPKEFIMFWWKKIDLDTFFDYIDIISTYAGIFQSERVEVDNYDIVTLHHDMGKKWSGFLANYLQAGLKTCLSITPQVDLTENSVIARFRSRRS